MTVEYVPQKQGWNGRSQARPHMFVMAVPYKFCLVCGRFKTLSEFHKRPGAWDGVYTYCKECSRAQDRKRYRVRYEKYGPEYKRRQEYFTAPTVMARRRENVNSLYRKLRDEVFAGYGNKCGKCGFADKRALHIDHVNGDGSVEREQHKRATWLRIIIRENFPARYQLLCANCNTIKMYENKEFPGWQSHAEGGGICPRNS